MFPRRLKCFPLQLGYWFPLPLWKMHQVSLETRVVVEGMEPLISAGSVTHDSASTGSKGRRDSKNWGGVSEKMEKQSWHFFSYPEGEPALHVRVVWFIEDTALLIFLGKWIRGVGLFFVCLSDQKENYRRISKQTMIFIRLRPVQRKEAIRCWDKKAAPVERSVQCSLVLLRNASLFLSKPSCLIFLWTVQQVYGCWKSLEETQVIPSLELFICSAIRRCSLVDGIWYKERTICLELCTKHK